MTASNAGVVRVWWIDTSRTFMDVNVQPDAIQEAITTPFYNARISKKKKNISNNKLYDTAIPYRASTGPEQGFSCALFPHLFTLAGILVMKTGFSLLGKIHREIPVFITGMGLQCI